MTKRTRSAACSIARVAGGTILATLAVIGFGAPWLASLDAHLPFRFTTDLAWLGWLILLAAFALIVSAEFSFVQFGGATGTPNDPPRSLVARGPYRWLRNPLYVSGIATILGVALVFGSATVLLLATIAAPLFHLFIVFFEEPRLERRFGEDYRAYQRRVPRWIPRMPSNQVNSSSR